MADFELSCGLPPGSDFADQAALAEALGYSRIWIFDSAPLWEDPFVHLALAAARTTRIGLATAVLVPTERSVMATASAVATVARLAPDRLRVCFGTGLTSRRALGQPPMTIAALGEFVTALRRLLTGETASVDGRTVRMIHAEGLAAPRPINVPIWLSVFGPRGTALANDVADGVIGLPNPALPVAIITSGTVLDAGEESDSARALEAIGPWRVVDWHTAYAAGGAPAVDAMAGGREWRDALEALAPAEERHTIIFEGHVTHLTDRDQILLEHIDRRTLVGDAGRVGQQLATLAAQGFDEIIYTPSGPDVPRELREFAAAYQQIDATPSQPGGPS